MDKTIQEWMEFDEANSKKKAKVLSTEHTQNHHSIWAPPPEGVIKINCDATLDNKRIRTGWKIVARNWKREIQASWDFTDTKYSEAELEEGLALRQAVDSAIQCGWKAVEFQKEWN
ncbi:hypothetical protein ACH5RR_036422 [Cinchona calisaya]|uniref:RNase H type-1 domain-containing protein n=1 Tax=Cinchona calisaya TaxID=153742 RepID=A0ABD2Y399_9GENT